MNFQENFLTFFPSFKNNVNSYLSSLLLENLSPMPTIFPQFIVTVSQHVSPNSNWTKSSNLTLQSFEPQFFTQLHSTFYSIFNRNKIFFVLNIFGQLFNKIPMKGHTFPCLQLGSFFFVMNRDFHFFFLFIIYMS